MIGNGMKSCYLQSKGKDFQAIHNENLLHRSTILLLLTE